MPPPPVHLDKVLRHAERKLVNDENLKPTDLLDLYRRFLKLEEHRLKLAHGGGEGGRSFAQKRADLMAVVLRHIWEGAWQGAIRNYKGKPPRVSLMAVGGFGRGELNPYSDIDIHFLHDAKNPEDAAFVKEVVEQVLYMLWDVGFHVGHATRTPAEEVENANTDLRTKTALLESQLLIGDGSLYEEFGRTFERMCLKGKEQEFLDWRLADQAERHAKHGNTVFLQEPHVKNGCGGLRDYQNMLWMALVKRGIATSGGLVEAQLLTVTERKQLDAAYDFLLRLRTELHYLQKRNGDILTLQLQGRIANRFGYKQHTILRRTEALMREYYQHTYTIFQLSNNLARRFAGAHPTKKTRWSFLPFRAAKPQLIDGFLLQNGVLEASEPGIFTADPFRILRVFALAQQHHAEIGPELSARIRRRLSIIDRSFIYHKTTREIIRKIFSKKGEVGGICRLMHEHGVLGRLFPEFRPLTCLVQHEFFHRYTADEHTIVCMEMLDKILGAKEPPFSKYAPLMVSIERPDLLYLAMLLHDTGKSSNSRHHSEDSAVNAVRVSRRMHLDAKELATLVFLVDHHMTMSETARQRNLDDDETIIEFARVVQTKERLDLLMLLTFADYQGTDSRQSWSDWKELLLWQLYSRAGRALEGGSEFKLAEEQSLEELKKRVKDKLKDEIDPGEVDAHFKNLPPRYFNNLGDSQIADHVRYVHEFFFDQIMHDDAALKPTVHWTDLPDQGHSVATVVTWDRERCFAKITGAFAASGLAILSADINTRDDSIVIDTFRISTDRQEAVTDPRDKKAFAENLARSFSQGGYEFPALSAAAKRKAGYEDAEFPTRIYFDHQSSSDYTLLDLQSPDAPGLLYRVASTLADNQIDIGFARITTEKGAALDTFYITDQKGAKVTDEETLRRITQAITQSATHTTT